MFVLCLFLDYWTGLLGMSVYSKTDTTAILGYADEQVSTVLALDYVTVDTNYWSFLKLLYVFVIYRLGWSLFKSPSLLIVLKHLEGLLFRALNQRLASNNYSVHT